MTDESPELTVDPAEQLESIKKIRKMSANKLDSLDNSIKKFLDRFDKQQVAINGLYKQTQQQQRISTNILAVHDRLTNIVNLIETDKLNTKN